MSSSSKARSESWERKDALWRYSGFEIVGAQKVSFNFTSHRFLDSHLNRSSEDANVYKWPTPEVATERWRYNTIKECQAALKLPTSEWDKESFKEALDYLRNQMIETIDGLIVMDKTNVQAVQKITKKATKLWLDFGTQRCRVLLVFEGSNVETIEEKIRLAKESTLELLVEPKLIRLGISKGYKLESSEVIGGCAGQLAKLQWSSQGGKA